MIAPTGKQIEIVAGDQRAVAVEVGGGLRSYTAGGREVIDGYDASAMSVSGRGQVLIPWPNRLQDGSYEFEGSRHQLPLNEPERRNAIHGLVRWAAWRLSEREPHRAVMTHILYPQPGYPFTLELSIEYALSSSGLRVGTTATNIGKVPCPFGGGAHPYLTLGTGSLDSLILRVPARTVLRPDERGLPVGADPVENSEYDFRKPRRIGSTKLDHAFTRFDRDEDGLARVDLLDPDQGTQVSLWVDESYPYLMLFTGDSLRDIHRRSLAVEPMTCPPNAFRTNVALIKLDPGSSFTGTWGIIPGRACGRQACHSPDQGVEPAQHPALRKASDAGLAISLNVATLAEAPACNPVSHRVGHGRIGVSPLLRSGAASDTRRHPA